MKKDIGRNIFQKYIKKSVMLKYALWSETRYIQQNVWNSEKILTVRLNRSESCENFWKPQQLSGTCHCQTAQSKIDDVVKTFEIILETPYYLDVVKPPGCDTIPNYWKNLCPKKQNLPVKITAATAPPFDRLYVLEKWRSFCCHAWEVQL